MVTTGSFMNLTKVLPNITHVLSALYNIRRQTYRQNYSLYSNEISINRNQHHLHCKNKTRRRKKDRRLITNCCFGIDEIHPNLKDLTMTA